MSRHCHRVDPCDVADYIVVGVGTAGAILIENLTRDRQESVIGIEWGQDLRDDPNTQYPSGLGELIINQKYAENYLIQGTYFPYITPVLSGVPNWFACSSSVVSAAYSMCRTVGGTSLHANVAHRASPQFYETLASIGGDRWKYSNVLPFLKALETYSSYPDNVPVCDAPERGCQGPIEVLQTVPFASIEENEVFAATLSEELPSHPPVLIGTEDYNAGLDTYISSYEGQIYERYNQENPYLSIKVNTLNSIMEKITDKDGDGLDGRKLRILTKCFVERVIFDRDTAIGVEYIRGNKVRRIYARKKVILCAGTLRTPLILEQSGIGRQDVLDSCEIKPRRINNYVGENLRDSLYTGLFFGSPDPDFLGASFCGRFYLDLADLDGVEQGGQSYPPYNIQSGASAASYLYDMILMDQMYYWSPISIVTASPTKGSVHSGTNSSSGQPYINMPFFELDENGVNRDGVMMQNAALYFNRVLKKVAQKLPAEQFTMVYPPQEVFDAIENGTASPDDLTAFYLTNVSKTGIHQTGSCSMAKNEGEGVVDGDLHVFGVKNLMIADLSVIPLAADANTMDLALVVGQVAASIIKRNNVGPDPGLKEKPFEASNHTSKVYEDFQSIIKAKEEKLMMKGEKLPLGIIQKKIARHQEIEKRLRMPSYYPKPQ